MVGALKDLGVSLEEDWEHDKITVHGCAGKFPVEDAKLYLGNAGTAMRYSATTKLLHGNLDVYLSSKERYVSGNNMQQDHATTRYSTVSLQIALRSFGSIAYHASPSCLHGC